MNNDDDVRQSADDALEPKNGLFNPSLDEEKLPEDNSTPASPPTTGSAQIPPDHPLTDSLNQDEVYQEGILGASGIDKSQIKSDEQAWPLEPQE